MISNQIYYGVIESRDDDPKKLGRCKVRIVGIHTEDNVMLPTKMLPWAYPLMPVHSASMSGIGFSPTGAVEGTWCAVMFRDEHQQHPVIIGTIGGIPEDETPKTVTTTTYKVIRQDVLKDGNGNVVTDGSGQPVLTGKPKEVTITEEILPPTDIKKPSSLSVSAAGIQFIMNKEALSSLVKGKNAFTTKAVDPETKIYSYLDADGRYVIGYGNSLLADGSPVTIDTVVLAKELPSILNRHITAEVERYIKPKLVAPVTQQMYDAIIDIAYNSGAPSFVKSDIFSSINTGKYKDAAALIPFYKTTVKGVENKGVKNRRLAEQKFFLSGGIPNSSFTDVEKDVPLQTEVPAEVPTPTSGGTNPSTSTVEVVVTTNAANGFKDPRGQYPIKTLMNEPDTHRLARSESIYESIIFAKEAARAKRIRKAFYLKRKLEWSQPPIPYNAKYPYNQTRVTESGHVEEWDDTKDSERIHRYHRSGTFEEVDRNGTKTTRIVGDHYEIMERHGHVIIKGTCNVTILGDSNIRVENDAYLEVLGNMNTRVTGDYELRTKGDIKFHTEGKFKVETFQDIHVHADGNINIEAVGNIVENAEKIELNPSGPPGPIKMPDEWEEKTGIPEFTELTVATRTAEDSTNYESPDEGDSTIFRADEIARGDVDPVDAANVKVPEETIESRPTPPTPPPVPPVVPPIPPKDYGDILPSLRLSPNYTLGQVSKDIPIAQFGKSANQIVENLRYLANNVLELVRPQFPNMIVTSGFRSDAKNRGLKGASKTSKHLIGGAVDMVFSGFNAQKLFATANEIQAMLKDYDQILMEYKGGSMWIHVSAFGPGSGEVNRRIIGTLDVDKNQFYNGVFKVLR
jgi:GH24 family phage-related lysozyme (muramidase)